MSRYARAVLGGTFDRLHVGHEALLRTAFAHGRSVAIGVTSDRYLAALPKPDAGRLQPYATRRAAVRRWVRRHYPDRDARVVALDDAFGGSVRPDVGVLVVSAETAGGGRAVNRERRRRGLGAVPVVVVPLVLADDLRPVASRRIRAGEIDRSGHRRAPLRIALAAPDESALAWAVPAVRRAFPSARLETGTPTGRSRADAAVPPGGLRVEVVRGRAGWLVRESSDAVRLGPRPLAGHSARSRTAALTAALRPGVSARGGRI